MSSWRDHWLREGTDADAHLDLVVFTYAQREFSTRAFGPGPRLEGVVDHIRKELIEVLAAPDDPSEWADLIILAIDGAWRQGIPPEVLATALRDKQALNARRRWPDWRTAAPGEAIEHLRG